MRRLMYLALFAMICLKSCSFFKPKMYELSEFTFQRTPEVLSCTPHNSSELPYSLTFYYNNKVRNITYSVNNKKENMCYSFYTNGVLQSMSEYKNGKKNGRTYEFYESGTLHFEYIYENDINVGYGAEYRDSTGYLKTWWGFNEKGEVYKQAFYDEGGYLIKTLSHDD